MVTPIMRTRVAYSGWVGGPGLTTFYHDPPLAASTFDQTTMQAGLTRVRAWCVAAQAYYATGVVPTLNPQVDIIDAESGDLINTMVGDVGAVIAASTGGVSYAPAVSLLIQWKTNGIVHGRQVKGRTFISPFNAGMVSAGVAIAGAISGLPSISAPLIAGGAGEPDLVVWSRPVKVATERVPVRSGSVHKIVSVTTPAKLAVMRSRRD